LIFLITFSHNPTMLAISALTTPAKTFSANAHAASPPKVVVVGGGAGGLASAGRLARAGCNVTLLEKNAELGGRVQSEHINGWRFDTGPSLLLFPQKYEETFEALGTPMASVVDICRVEPAAYRVFFPSSPGYSIDLLNNPDEMAAQLEKLEPGAGASFFKFVAMAKSHLDIGMPYFIDRSFDELTNAKSLFDLLPKLSSINPWQMLGPHDMVMRNFFKDPRLRAAFTFQDLYVGLTPGSAPAVFSLLAGTELTDGVWYPRGGGFQTIRDGLETAIKKCGVEVKTNSEVKTIEVEDKNGAVKGVRIANGDFIEADVVVCNRDLPAAYDLLEQSVVQSVANHAAKETKKLSNLKYSMGVIAYNWCITGKLEGLAHHNVFLSEKFEAAWKPAATPRDFPQYPNFYVHVPSKTDPSAAPEGCDSVMILLPVAHMQLKAKKTGESDSSSTNYEELVAAGRQKILDSFKAAGIGGDGAIEDMIAHEMVIAPPQWKERYGVQHGAAFGLSHSLDQLSLFRPGNKDEAVPGLYFVGASTRPGNGVPLCFIGAKLTSERILKDYGLMQ
jgi:phytoene desaturase (3,4-didehydrolycopene-forming)